MLRLVQDRIEKQHAQTALETRVREKLASQGVRNIGFPAGNVDEVVYTNGSGDLWAAFSPLDDAKVPRRWNAFGVYDPKRHAQMITVEINVPTTSNSALVAGFFAKDAETDRVYLLHDGSIGGGRPGVGRQAFLASTKVTLEDVLLENGGVRSGVVVGAVDSDDFVPRLWRFVQQVQAFKAAVRAGAFDSPEAAAAIAEWDDFNSESPGRRRGRRLAPLDYMSYHGEVVERLYEERYARRRNGERVLNSRLIDLYVRRGVRMIEIYEVKTSTDRQAVYTGIGQLLTHSTAAPDGVRRVLVLPEGALAPDLDRALRGLGIELRRFTIGSGRTPKVVLSPAIS